jgi:hypothetical protein
MTMRHVIASFRNIANGTSYVAYFDLTVDSDRLPLGHVEAVAFDKMETAFPLSAHYYELQEIEISYRR